jgi:hypothetical protein
LPCIAGAKEKIRLAYHALDLLLHDVAIGDVRVSILIGHRQKFPRQRAGWMRHKRDFINARPPRSVDQRVRIGADAGNASQQRLIMDIVCGKQIR